MYKKILCNGSGNTFFLIHCDDFQKIDIKTDTVREICGYGQGSDIDGMLTISSLQHNQYKLDYYNCDGTWETLCINGSLCAARYMAENFIKNDQLIFIAGDGTHRAIINKSGISISMRPPVSTKSNISILGHTGSLIDSGAKHFCIIVDRCTPEIVTKFGPDIRHDDAFHPYGVNVNFIELIDRSVIKVFTYEKGVEKFMPSCGSGSVAAIFYVHSYLASDSSQAPQIQSPCSVITPKGKFIITFNDQTNWTDTYISGPTEISSVQNIKSLIK